LNQRGTPKQKWSKILAFTDASRVIQITDASSVIFRKHVRCLLPQPKVLACFLAVAQIFEHALDQQFANWRKVMIQPHYTAPDHITRLEQHRFAYFVCTIPATAKLCQNIDPIENGDIISSNIIGHNQTFFFQNFVHSKSFKYGVPIFGK
jgi:hypothetical protein